MNLAGTLLKRRHFPSLPSGVGYLLAMGAGFATTIAIKAILVANGVETPLWL